MKKLIILLSLLISINLSTAKDSNYDCAYLTRLYFSMKYARDNSCNDIRNDLPILSNLKKACSKSSEISLENDIKTNCSKNPQDKNCKFFKKLNVFPTVPKIKKLEFAEHYFIEGLSPGNYTDKKISKYFTSRLGDELFAIDHPNVEKNKKNKMFKSDCLEHLELFYILRTKDVMLHGIYQLIDNLKDKKISSKKATIDCLEVLDRLNSGARYALNNLIKKCTGQTMLKIKDSCNGKTPYLCKYVKRSKLN